MSSSTLPPSAKRSKLLEDEGVGSVDGRGGQEGGQGGGGGGPGADKFRFAIDRGGTFTDVYAELPNNGGVRVLKLLSVDPAYPDAPTEGIRRVLEACTGESYPRGQPIDPACIGAIRMGTTVATNALLERKGEPVALVISRGLRDLLAIGNQARPKLFDLSMRAPDVLYEHVVEADGRLVLDKTGPIQGATGERLCEEEPLNESKLRTALAGVRAKGIRSLAVVLMHSYLYPAHEERVGEVAREMGFDHVSLSSEVMPMVKIVPRGHTALADAYLTPCIKRYLEGFTAGFRGGLHGVPVAFMQSDGGLTPMASFIGSRAIVSGPAGGVVGYATTAYDEEAVGGPPPVIGFDMGGTSTDVSRYGGGAYEHVFESTTAGVTIQSPQLDINTVAAGGGSRLFFRAGMFVVGPESAGAHPGPACYRKGGPATVTDANLVLGRLRVEQFPRIFGPKRDAPLDVEASHRALERLATEVNTHERDQGRPDMSIEAVALGFVRVANEAMCRPIRELTQSRGYDASHHRLACFGGAGGQHACAVARALGMGDIHVARHSGILSAYGIAVADVVEEAQGPCACELVPEQAPQLLKALRELAETCCKRLKAQGFADEALYVEPYLNVRYDRTNCALMTPPGRGGDRQGSYGEKSVSGSSSSFTLAEFNALTAQVIEGTASNFTHQYAREFGFTIPGRALVVDDLRVRATGRIATSTRSPRSLLPAADSSFSDTATAAAPAPTANQPVVFEGADGVAETHATPVYSLEGLAAGHTLAGPVLIVEANSTILVEPGCQATVTSVGDVVVRVGGAMARHASTALDLVQLSLFQHRFMTIAEQMGRSLQRTSISTNIKERLDFSCALFGPDGGLVANAPHIPVHLGAMQEAVRYQIENASSSVGGGDKDTISGGGGGGIREGDVLVSNHPKAGGSHLPDITVITPVFRKGHATPLFWVAARGHHADIGGSTPGSMPAHSHSLREEGAAITSFHLVRGGRFDEAGITALLQAPAREPGCSGTRNLADNLADLKAQVAANNRGIQLVNALMDETSAEVVVAYMGHIQENAELAVREMLREVAANVPDDAVSSSPSTATVAAPKGGEGEGEDGAKKRTAVLHAEDFLDDGSPIRLRVEINRASGDAIFDFDGTGAQLLGNLNAPRAVTYSAIIYCLRCMIGHDIPLNQGCLGPVQIKIPQGSLLWPHDEAAVVGGNVLTSQRVVDVVLRAFGSCAASQGCMNNVTFGDESVGYYETVCGGGGAGPGWHGRSGIHSHMTNTRITDPEILERRYPVVLQAFHLRSDTGGAGKWRGGDGVVRELRFLRPLSLSVLTERRVFAPYGMAGGSPGARGHNYLLRAATGERISLGSKARLDVATGDVFRLETPGGGGYGKSDEAGHQEKVEAQEVKKLTSATATTSHLRGSVHEYHQAQLSA